MVEQPITSGLRAGNPIKMHLIDRAGNATSPLFSIDMMRRLRMVVDYAETTSYSKANPPLPGTWHGLPVTKKGLMLISLTKGACEHMIHHHHRSLNKQPDELTDAKMGTAQFCVAEACDCH